jgi:flagellar FliL protein
MEEVLDPKKRKHLKEELLKEVEHLYHDEVMDLYFTEFVTQ